MERGKEEQEVVFELFLSGRRGQMSRKLPARDQAAAAVTLRWATCSADHVLITWARITAARPAYHQGPAVPVPGLAGHGAVPPCSSRLPLRSARP